MGVNVGVVKVRVAVRVAVSVAETSSLRGIEEGCVVEIGVGEMV